MSQRSDENTARVHSEGLPPVDPGPARDVVPSTAGDALPDVASEARPAASGALDWVGMRRIEVPVLLEGEDGIALRAPARVDAFVDLARADARGIHMSRLYLHVDSTLPSEPLTPCSLRRLLRSFLDSHAGLSTRALLRVEFDYMLRRPALRSDNSGWRAYPVVVTALMEQGQLQLELAFTVTYSSTCPCSAALARQLIEQRFRREFAEDLVPREAVAQWLASAHGIHATPHSQRSSAEVRVRLAPSFAGLPVVELIDLVEDALQTPVQTAVKRIDEQAFAERNGANLMFCEDAARRVQRVLDQDARVTDFLVRASHFESLHPHDAVAVASKGVDGGYRADP